MTQTPKPQKLVALINLSSSSATDISTEMSVLLERYGYKKPTILAGYSEDLPQMLEQMHRSDGDIFISYGGDGTSGAVAGLAREKRRPFLPLPGGTMNMLMQGLYGSVDWQDCLLQGLAVAQPRPMTVGLVIDGSGREHPFMVGAIFGKVTQMSEAREVLREGHMIEAAKDAINILSSASNEAALIVSTAGDDLSLHPVALINVLCPFMSGDALNPNTMDVMMVDRLSAGTSLSIGLAAMRGALRSSDTVQSLETQQFTVQSDDPIEALLDGEPHRFDAQITVRLNPSCGQVMAPRPALSFPARTNFDGAAS